MKQHSDAIMTEEELKLLCHYYHDSNYKTMVMDEESQLLFNAIMKANIKQILEIVD